MNFSINVQSAFTMFLRTVALPVVILAVAFSRASAAEPRSVVSFARDIAPILVQKCEVCHDAEKNKGHFQVTTFDRLMKPGSSDLAPITPGQPEQSELFRLLTTKNADDRMPQKDEPLPDKQIALIENWIRAGARFDGPDPKVKISTLLTAVDNAIAPTKYSRPIPIAALAFRPDGKELAATGYFEVNIWDPATGKLVRRLKPAPERVQALAYSPDGSKLAVAGGSPGQSGEVKLFDLGKKATAKSLGKFRDVVLALDFSADGTRLAVGGADNSIRIYNTASGKQELLIEQHADWVAGVVFSHDAARIASASRDRSARIYNAMTGELEVSYLGHEAPVFTVAFSSDDQTVYSGGRDKKVHTWNSKDGKSADKKKNVELGGFDGDIFKLVATSNQLFSSCSDQIVRLHSLPERKELRTYTGLHDWAYTLAVSGGTLAAGSYDGEIRIWQINDGTLRSSFKAAPGLLTPSKRQ